MRCFGIGLVLFVTVALVSAARAEGPQEGGSGDRGANPAQRMLERFDSNNDGKLSRDEVPEAMWGRLSRFDSNNDAVITSEELAQIRGQGRSAGGPGPEHPVEAPSPLLRIFDQDRDGILSKEEIKAAPEVLRKLDKNGDGKLTSDEMPSSSVGGDDRRGGRGGRSAGGGPTRGNRPGGFNGLEFDVGDLVPSLSAYDEQGKPFELSSMKGHYSVLVFGCLT